MCQRTMVVSIYIDVSMNMVVSIYSIMSIYSVMSVYIDVSKDTGCVKGQWMYLVTPHQFKRHTV